MGELTGREIAEKLTEAGRLKANPLSIYGSEVLPDNAVSTIDINRCIARAIFSLPTEKEVDAVYIEEDEKRGTTDYTDFYVK